MSIDVNKLIVELEIAEAPRGHPVDLVLDSLAEGQEEAYKRTLWALRNPEHVSAPALSNALQAAGADVRPSQVNSWRRREGVSLGKGRV